MEFDWSPYFGTYDFVGLIVAACAGAGSVGGFVGLRVAMRFALEWAGRFTDIFK